MFGKRKGPSRTSDPKAPQAPETGLQEGQYFADEALRQPPAQNQATHSHAAQPQSGQNRPPMSAGAAAAAGKAPPRRAENRSAGVEGRKLVVGREICLSGEIKTCEKLVVEGRVEADLNDSQSLEISEPGLFRGCAKVEDCEVSGTFEGDLTVTGVLRVLPTGRVSGKIRYANLEVSRGAKLSGDIDSLDGAAAEGERPARGSGPKLAHANPDDSKTQAG
jgi:cytoskeletal protein CcmA (bactofilin family)